MRRDSGDSQAVVHAAGPDPAREGPRDPGRVPEDVRVTPTKASPEELAEARWLVSKFREMGASEYDACMTAAQIQIAMRGMP